MQIRFEKAHGAKNDFLLTREEDLPEGVDLARAARAICARNTGVGADGWMLVDARPGIRLFNSDGSEPELSGNGTRCAAAFLIRHGRAAEEMEIATGAGPKRLRLLSRHGLEFEFEMNMGRPRVIAANFPLPLRGGTREAVLIDCGNPQCAVTVENFDFDWPAVGAEIERHAHFPNRTNVSFVRRLNEHAIEARFFERGAGVTMSSGTGSTGAAVCAIQLGIARSPVRVVTAAGALELEERDGDMYLRGPAEIVAEGTFFYHGSDEHDHPGSGARR